MEAILGVLAIPLGILNLLGGIVSIIWLAFLGEWHLVLFGIAYAFVGTFLISLVLLPGMIFAAPAAMAAERGKPWITLLLGVPSIIWTYFVLFGSCYIFLKIAVQNYEGQIIPYLLWAYATAIGPWTYMAQKEEQLGNESSIWPVFGAQVGTLLGAIALYIDPSDSSLDRVAIWMSPGLALGLALQFFQMYVNTRRPRYFR